MNTGFGGNDGNTSSGFTNQFPIMSDASNNPTTANTPVSLMAAAEESAASLASSQQDKWRKLFFHMRIKLKPRDIGVR